MDFHVTSFCTAGDGSITSNAIVKFSSRDINWIYTVCEGTERLYALGLHHVQYMGI